MRNELLGTLRLSIIDNLRAEIREREGVIADLTKDGADPRKIDVRTADVHVWNPTGALLSPTRPMPVSGLVPFFHDESVNGLRPTHGDAIADVRNVVAKKGKRGRVKAGQRKRRTPADIEDTGQDILDYVREFPGQRGEQITEALGMSAKEMRNPMKALIAKRLVSTRGQRRGMVYTATKKGGGK